MKYRQRRYEIFCSAKYEIKFIPNNMRSIFHTRSVFHIPQEYFIHSAGMNFIEKSLSFDKDFSGLDFYKFFFEVLIEAINNLRIVPH